MDITKEFEVAQEIYAERLSKQDEEAAQKTERTKKFKRKHTTKGQNEMESEQNKGDTQVEEMTSEVAEIKTNTDMETDMTLPQSDIEGTESQAIGVGTEDHQTPDLSLTKNVQLIEMDLQWKQRLAERLEAELRKNAQEQVLKDKEVEKVLYSAVAKGPIREQAPKEKEKRKLSYSEVTRGQKEVQKRAFDEDRQEKISKKRKEQRKRIVK
ncbi:45034_t:CDS:1 [Gigaspora margarita]|uniref:45034_t:CDS:1 n=1 Tax=Gigaspora margarita TaxID=4874 RepID=A0ABN7VZH5_GIGMA|nr:45034_t:CDS:1 [Gigaspora margarita]